VNLSGSTTEGAAIGRFGVRSVGGALVTLVAATAPLKRTPLYALHVAIGFFGRGQRDPDNRIASGNGLNQPILGLAIKLESTVSHRNLSNHIRGI